MSAFLLATGAFILSIVLLALLRILRAPSDAERLMATQLLGSGGVAALLLLGSSIDLTGATDLALVLVLLGVFAAVAFVAGLGGQGPTAQESESAAPNPGDPSADQR